MGKAPTFSESELRRAMKVADEAGQTVCVVKRIGECEIRFVPVDAPAPKSPDESLPKW